MADKAISDLTQALQITNEDLFVLDQGGTAKKLKGATLLDFVTLSVVSVTVTTLPAGSSATATYDKSTGTLALGIPQGNKGDTGATGATGATGPQGEPGPAGKDGITPEIVEGELVEVPSAALDTFIDNTDIDYLYDESTGAYYTVIRVYKQKLDGSYQYPFVYAPNGAGAGDKSTYDMTVEAGWLLAINSGIFNTSTKKPDGIVIQNGTVVQNAASATHSQCKPLTIDSNGDLSYAAYDVDAAELVAAGIVSAVCGFMPIVVDYAAVDSSEWNSVSHYTQNAQRQIIGQWGNGDYAIITCEGKGYHNSDGWTIAEAQAVCIRHGLKFAYNLDGGGSTETMLGHKPVNTIYENATGRVVPTFIVFSGSTVPPAADETGFEPVTANAVYLIGYTNVVNNTGISGNSAYSWHLNVVTTRIAAVTTEPNIEGQQAETVDGVNYYPIPVPRRATKVIITCPGFIPGDRYYSYDSDAKVYTSLLDAGWNSEGGVTREFEAGTYEYMTVNFKTPNSFVIPTDTDTSGFSIVFE